LLSATDAQPRVNFFVAGVQKAGTTALDTLLRQHPNVQMARVKEPHFFDNETRDWDAPNEAALHDLFDWTSRDVVRGESTPIYTFWPHSLERIKTYNPNAKLIIGLRHPTFRAFSQWRMEVTRGNETLSFERAVEARTRAGTSDEFAHRHFSYVERGFYAAQVATALRLFGRERCFFYRTDRLWSAPENIVTTIHRFLDVPPIEPVRVGYVGPLRPAELGAIPDVVRRRFDHLFSDDVRQLGALTGLDLSDWLDDGYSEPIRPEDRGLTMS
jgi:hypothetical protein